MRKQLVGAIVFITSVVAVQLPAPYASATYAGKYTGKLAVVHITPNAPPALELYNPGKYGNPAFKITAASTSDDIESPAWSPDGTKIAFMLDQNVYIANADTTNMHQVSTVFIDPTIHWSIYDSSYHPPTGVAWSPDGKRLAFTTQRTLYTINADGTGLTKLGDGQAKPSWSVTNQLLVPCIYFYDGDFRGCVYLVNPDGTNAQDFTGFDPATTIATPDWSPDGKQVTFSASSLTAGQSIYTAAADGSNMKALPQPAYSSSNSFLNPTWTPTSDAITYETKAGMYPFTDTIYNHNLATNTDTKLFEGSAGEAYTEPAWQPLATAPTPVDNVPPKTSMTKATNNIKARSQWVFTASASDNVGVVKVEFYVSNKNTTRFAGSATGAPYSVSWDSGLLANGIYQVRSKATDAAGNITYSTPRTIILHAFK